MNPARRFLERWSSAWPVASRVGALVPPPRARLGVAAALSLAASLVELLRPLPLQWIVDHALVPGASAHANGAVRAVWIGAASYAALSVARAGFDYFAALSLAEAVKEFTRRLRGRVFERLLRLSPRFHARNRTGDLISRLQGDVALVSGMMTESVVELAARAFLIAGTLAMLFWIDPLLAAGTTLFAPLALVVVSRLSRGIHTATRKARRKEGVFASQGHEALANVALVQSLCRVDHLLRDYLRASRRSASADCKASRIAARLGASIELLSGFALAVALLWGSQRVLAGRLSAGELLAFVAYVRAGVKPVRQSSRSSARIAKGAACGERILAVLEDEVDVTSLPGAPAAPRAPRTLEFRGVSYSYDAPEGAGDRERALDSFWCVFRRGESTLVFGPSGSGKSTLAALASRLMDPDAGAVAVDGEDLRTLDLGSLRAAVASSPQADQLFGWTVRENLLLGKPDAVDAELWSALRDAAAEDFVRALPQGLDTQLGTLGAGLSGGQKKRLCLARTFLCGAGVVLLDEPFAGLDAASVEILQRTIARRSRTEIVVVIAHERAEVAKFDRIVFLDHGRAREGDVADELLRGVLAPRAAALPLGTEAG
jgi:ATP-binding cassette subfamily B protein